MSNMGFWELLQSVIDERDTTEARILKRAELGKGTFSAWRARGIPMLPSKEQILALSKAMRVEPGDLVIAILITAGFVITKDGRLLSPEHGTISDFASQPLSERPDRPDLAIAAHEEVSIAGEQESRNDP